MEDTILITGGAGFIGSAVIRHIIGSSNSKVVNIDKLTYAGNLNNLVSVSGSDEYYFEKIDICNAEKVAEVFKKYQPDMVMHLAAESHVDRSISGPADFIKTNILGTYVLLEETRKYFKNLKDHKRKSFRFHHVSTDEVYGDLEKSNDLFTEKTRYDPSSPYSASKASSDHLVRAWGRTFGLPILITNCSNNYGPYQFTEKLIPNTVLSAIKGRELPVYGHGQQIRDWLFVDDHAKALIAVLKRGRLGETYNIGGHNQIKNIDVVKMICDLLDELAVNFRGNLSSFHELITFVEDRAGHDFKYAIDTSKIQYQLNWNPAENFTSGLRKTVKWYLANPGWAK